MSLPRLKIAFAVITLACATMFWLVVALDGDPSVLSFGYLPIAAAFGTAICLATMHEALPEHPFVPRRALYKLISAYTFLPLLLSLDWLLRKGPTLAVWAFLMASAVMSLLYLIRYALSLSKANIAIGS